MLYWYLHTQTGRHTYRQTDRHADTAMLYWYIHRHRQTDIPTDRQTDRHVYTYIHTYIQTDRQRDRHTSASSTELATILTVYTVYSVYSVYTVYSVYSVYTVYTVYTVYSVYTVYTGRRSSLALPSSLCRRHQFIIIVSLHLFCARFVNTSSTVLNTLASRT